jgi:outer membrane immunogenic protein
MRSILASAAVVAVLATGSAMAADMSVPFKAAPVMVAPTYNWTGCYLGIHGGGAAFRDNGAGIASGTWSDGGLFGGQVGCNYQIDHLVVGVEGEGAWSGVDSTQNFGVPGALVTSTFKNDWDADVAVRFGLAYDRFFIYEKIGVMWGENKYTVSAPGTFVSGSATLPGLFWGLGLEYGLTAQWTAKIETDFVHFAANDLTLTCSGVCAGTAVTSTNAWAVITKIGLNYRW